MNNRIMELAEQANRPDVVTPSSMWPPVDKQFAEKFAKLLIEECAEICIKENVSSINIDDFNSGKFTIQDLATRSCGENLATIIKKRFGTN